MVDVVVSYAHEDADVARRLDYLFGLEDWSCWWDPRIPLGEDFRPYVDRRIDAAAVVVVLWSPAARASTWVRLEADRARRAGKLLDLIVRDEPERAGTVEGGALVIHRHPHIPPIRDEVLARVARRGGLRRRSDGWNSWLHATGWRGRPPRRPVIGWEWVQPGTPDHRLVRRERWTGVATVTYGTTIGNAWLFGHEGELVPIGYLFVTRPEHRVQLPKPDRAAERRRRADSLGAAVIPFNVEVRTAELLEGLFYPDGGVDLGARS